MKRSKFNLSRTLVVGFDFGQLIPLGFHEVLPGDVFNHKATSFIRIEPMYLPVMHPTHVDIRTFFVPLRLIWSGFEDFITGNSDVEWPHKVFTRVESGDLADYLGMPGGVYTDENIKASMLPFRAYNLIYNEWFRDEKLQDPAAISYDSGVDSTTSLDWRRAGWPKDRFNTARDAPQDGDAVTIPIEESELYPEDVRRGLALQRFGERLNQHGDRYTEYLRSMGVNPPDARLDRPEYLGGGRSTLQYDEVLQTGVGTTGRDVVGMFRGHGIGACSTGRFVKHFKEHGILMSMMTIRPMNIYREGTPKGFFRRTFDQYYQPELQDLGMDKIEVGEVDLISAADHTAVFGYQDRYDDYRHEISFTAGDMNDDNAQFHFGRLFTQEPVLNGTFVQCMPTNVPFRFTGYNQASVMTKIDLRARRFVKASSKPKSF